MISFVIYCVLNLLKVVFKIENQSNKGFTTGLGLVKKTKTMSREQLFLE